MKTDSYTKIILTIIAACLVINVLEKIDLTSKAYAHDTAKTLPALPETPKYGLVPLNPDGSINVNFTSTAPMDVNIVGIRTNDDLDVNVNLARVGGSSVYGGIPVKVDK